MRNTTSVALTLVILVAYMANMATAETRIEVDENGDEYELKRFYIQGRQLAGEGSKGQCVVTRRKRSSRSLAVPSNVAVSSQQLKVSAVPVQGQSDTIGVEHREALIQLTELDQNNHRYVTVKLADNNEESDDDDDQDDDDDDDEDDETIDDDDDDLEDDDDENNDNSVSNNVAKAQSYVPAALALPLSQTAATAAHLPEGVSVVANGAAQANVVGGDAGIVVVQSHQPPKVNPDTHAVFELKPVRQAELQSNVPAYPYPFIPDWLPGEDDAQNGHDDDADDDDDYDEDYYYHRGDLVGPLGEYEAEIFSEENPISTEAIWSTDGGEEDIPVKKQRPIRNKQQQKKKNKKNNNQQQQQQQMKNKRKQNQKETQKRRRPQQNKRKQDEQEDIVMNQQDEAEPVQEQPIKKKKQQQQQEYEVSHDKEQSKPSRKPSGSNSGSSSNVSSNSSSSSSLEPSKKPKKPRPSNSSGSNGSTSSSSLNKRKPKPQQQQQQKKKRKSRPSNSSSSIGSSSGSSSVNKRRRRPSSSSISSSSSSRPIGGYRRRRPSYQSSQSQSQQQRRRRQKQKRRQQQEKRRRQQQRRRRLRQKQNNRNRQFYGNEPIINCIYINKDSPTTTTTTQRPFWNILGREAGNKQEQGELLHVDPVAQQAALQAVRRNSGDFGQRKRTNLRFVA